MAIKLTFDQALDIWRGAILETVRRDAPDLTARQMAVALSVYLAAPPHTVRGLAKTLNVSKPATTRALDRLEKLDFVKHTGDDTAHSTFLIHRPLQGPV